jgi:hypothetical protein
MTMHLLWAILWGYSEMHINYLRELHSNARLPRTYLRAFHGVALDDRGRYSVCATQAASNCTHTVKYDPDRFVLLIDDCEIRASDDIKFHKLFEATDVLIDSTTLDVPELVLLTKFLSTTCSHIDYFYVEPQAYKLKNKNGADVHGFALSSSFSPFSPIPGFTPELSTQRQGNLLVFLGFESSRLSRALSPDEVAYIQSSNIAFGVPPFQASWEMHALMQNAEVLNEANLDGIYFVGANDPLAAYKLIESVSESINPNSERLVLAPLGTKPASISVALFAALHTDVRIMFDFPRRLPERTEGVGRLHHYGVALR